MKRLVIDLGHGGHDPGAIGPNKTHEADVVLAIGKELDELLKGYELEVKFTRLSNVYLSLSERAKIANDFKADYFLSIHINSATDSSVRGVEVWQYSNKNDKLNKFSNGLCEDVSKIFNVRNRGVKLSQKLSVLKNTNMPAALIEVDFISNVNAENDLKSIYLGIDNQIKDINYIAELRGKKTNIDIDVQGALKDSAKKNFKGTIDFKKGAKKSKGNENEYCMLLSNKAKSIALPMLLCTEEDVEGNHSTASGKVDMKQLFYLMTRGLSYKEAVKLIVKANFQKIIDRINDEELNSLDINMNFLGLNLAQIPTRSGDWKAFIIPVLYVLVSVISLRITNPTPKKKDGEEKNSEDEFDPMAQMNKNMNLMFPVMYLAVALIAPLGLALYWLMNSLLMIIERLALNKMLKDEEE